MSAAVTLRAPVAGDAAEFIAQVCASRKLHAGWVSPPDSEDKFSVWLKNACQDTQRSFLIFEGTAIAGAVNLSNIVRGNFCSAYLGYYAFASAAGRGVMTEGLTRACRFAFRELGLHRLEANIQPDNAASIALAKRCGFRLEGYSPRYLKIGGRWRDHERWALVKE